MLPSGYGLDTIDLPSGVPFEASGIETRPTGNYVVSTRAGDIWEYDVDDEEWSLVTNALHTSIFLWADDDSGDLYTAQMPELTRIIDSTGDGRADRFETITDEWGYEGNYHQFVYGPVRDSEGNFYVSIGLSHGGGGSVKGSTMGHTANFNGWVIKVTPDGEFQPFASGLRSCAGIAITEDDEVFITDNEGDYMPTNHLSHIREGEFYGHPAGLRDHPDFTNENLNDISDGAYDDMRAEHAAWIPYPESNSTTGIAINNEGNFGPFQGQFFLGEHTRSKVLRVALESVNGQYQGAVFNFAEGLDSGPVDLTFSPDGTQLWVAMTGRGWGSVGGNPFGIQRIIYGGTAIPFEMRTVSIHERGFDIEFTRPVAELTVTDPSNYSVSHWGYDNSSSYGSGHLDEQTLDSDEIDVTVVDDDVVRLDFPEIYITPSGQDGLLGGTRVYELDLDGVQSTDGAALEHEAAWYTVNHLP